MEIHHEWSPIEKLDKNHHKLDNPELRALSAVWSEQREILEERKVVTEFMSRLVREWSIETGILEHIYTLDSGTTRVLIEQGLSPELIPHDATDRSPDELVAILRDHQDAIEGIFDFVKGNRKLSTGYIKELHSVLTRHQSTVTAQDAFGKLVHIPLTRGEYKLHPNSPVRTDGKLHEYCPPVQTASEMDNLIYYYNTHIEEGIPPEVSATWLHHAFTQIHPFQDGNGRVARALASLVFIKAGWFPLTVLRSDREIYIRALESADEGDLKSLVDLFAKIQRRAFTTCLTLSQSLIESKRIEDVIFSVSEHLTKKREALYKEWEMAKDTADSLIEIAIERLESIKTMAIAQISPTNDSQFFVVPGKSSDTVKRHYYRYQIIDTARTLGYFANLREYHASARLALVLGTEANILVSIHGMGQEFRGILGASVSFYTKDHVDRKAAPMIVTMNASIEPFQINYKEDPKSVIERFGRWLDESLLAAMDMWRRGL